MRLFSFWDLTHGYCRGIVSRTAKKSGGKETMRDQAFERDYRN